MTRVLLLLFICTACANPIPPTGGKKDLDPPVLLSSNPPNRSLNFNSKVIVLEFDEYIREENLKNQLLITPRLGGDYEYRINRNRITLTFDESFDSLTTYTLNFREGIKDITEGNVPPNLQYVFSTGNYLDSAAISGAVSQLLTKAPSKDVTVSLYLESDTLTILDGDPLYSTRTDESGNFLIQNVKNGSYRLYALADKNQNQKLESQSEAYGFTKEPIELNDSITGVKLDLQNLDTRSIILQNSRPVGNNFDLKFNKYIVEYQLDTSNIVFHSNLVEKNRTLRIYRRTMASDSIDVRFTVTDSLYQNIDSTVYVMFDSATTRSDKLEVQFDLANGPVSKIIRPVLKFNKPMLRLNPDSIYFQFDTLRRITLPSTMWQFSEGSDQIKFNIDLNQILQADTTLNKVKQPFDLVIGPSVISVEQDTISRTIRTLTLKDPKEYGMIRGTINTNHSSFFVQLLDGNLKKLEEVHYTNVSRPVSYVFRELKPGTYSIRILVDENGNGRWDAGNIHKYELPEPVYLFFHPNVNSQAVNLRANWEQTGLDLTF